MGPDVVKGDAGTAAERLELCAASVDKGQVAGVRPQLSLVFDDVFGRLAVGDEVKVTVRVT